MLCIVRDRRTINSFMSNPISHDNIDQALSLLAGRLDLAQTDPVRLVICGGSALIAMSLRRRTTRDVDVVALLSLAQEPLRPDPCVIREAPAAARSLRVVVDDGERVVAVGGRLVNRHHARPALDALREPHAPHGRESVQLRGRACKSVRNLSGKAPNRPCGRCKLLILRQAQWSERRDSNLSGERWPIP